MTNGDIQVWCEGALVGHQFVSTLNLSKKLGVRLLKFHQPGSSNPEFGDPDLSERVFPISVHEQEVVFCSRTDVPSYAHILRRMVSDETIFSWPVLEVSRVDLEWLFDHSCFKPL